MSDHERRFQLLVEHAADAVFMVDPDGRIETWTPAAERIFAFPSSAAVGRDFGVFYLRGERERRVPEADLAAALTSGIHRTDAWRVRGDDTLFFAHVVTSPIFAEEGRLSGFAQIVRDQTSVQEAELARRRHATSLERSNRELEGYASIASHDLQEPLRKIRTFADRLRSRSAEVLDEDARMYLTRIEDVAARMQRLLDDLLAYSRLGGPMAPLGAVHLGHVVREVTTDLDAQIERSGGQVVVHELPTIEADASQMRQLFQNLLANALKFQVSGGARPLVEISSREVAPIYDAARRRPVPRWEITVKDNGIGFDPKHQERIFGMLARLHARHEYEGTGMGLAICRKIVERHDGEIMARSERGQGATFIVILPAEQPTTRG